MGRLAGAPRRLGLLLLFRALQDVVADLLELVQRAELELAAVVERDHHVPPEPGPPPDGHALLHALVAHVRLLAVEGRGARDRDALVGELVLDPDGPADGRQRERDPEDRGGQRHVHGPAPPPWPPPPRPSSSPPWRPPPAPSACPPPPPAAPGAPHLHAPRGHVRHVALRHVPGGHHVGLAHVLLHRVAARRAVARHHPLLRHVVLHGVRGPGHPAGAPRSPPGGPRRLLLHLVAGHDVDQEVEDVRLGDGRRNVVALQRPALVLLRVDPRAQRELEDEHLARLGEEHRGLRRDHPHVLVALHDLLDARQRELVVLELVRVHLHLHDLLLLALPELLQQLLVLRLHRRVLQT